MIFSRRNLICRSLIFSALGLTGILMFSQATFAAVGAAPGESTNAAELVIIPKLKSPVAVFRELLAMSPAERRQALTNLPPEVQKRILAKLLEYESLKSDEREFACAPRSCNGICCR